MRWAFWRRDDAAGESSASESRPRRAARRQDREEADEAQALRARARRRLIGAAALLLAAALVVPLVLDPAPRSVPDDVPIDIPSEHTPFKPRLALPPIPDPSKAPLAPPPDAELPVAETKKTETKSEPKPEQKIEKKDDGERAQAILEGKSPGAVAPVAKQTDRGFVLQVAAFGNIGAAKQLADRLKRAGLSAYTEMVAVKDGERHRVRVGPFNTRDEAERARIRMQEMDVKSSLVPLPTK